MVEEINNFVVSQLLIKNNKRSISLICDNIFDESSFLGILSPQILMNYLRKCIVDRQLRLTWPIILSYCDDSSITPDVFEYIRKYPLVSKRRTLMVNISHINLSFYQLEYICNHYDCLEAFAQLLNRYLLNDCFNVFDLQRLLDQNKKYVIGIDLQGIHTEYGECNEKLRLLYSYGKRMLK